MRLAGPVAGALFLMTAAPGVAQTPEGAPGETPRSLKLVSPRDFARAMVEEYPYASIKAGEQGTAHVQACVEADGKITEATILKSTGYARLDTATLKAVQRQKAIPAKDGAGAAVRFCNFQFDVTWALRR